MNGAQKTILAGLALEVAALPFMIGAANEGFKAEEATSQPAVEQHQEDSHEAATEMFVLQLGGLMLIGGGIRMRLRE